MSGIGATAHRAAHVLPGKLALMRYALVLAMPVLLASMPAAADSLPDVDVGLWEWTSVVHLDQSTIPSLDLDRLPPSVRAQVQAAMQRASGPHTYRGCLTEEKLRKGFAVGRQGKEAACTRHLISSSSTALAFTVECQSSQGDIATHVALTATDRRSMDGLVTRVVPGQQGPGPVLAHITGKWLGADCGDTK
ncbi:MAG TPA: DUF3617 family protein [Acetobacteraceae bacterium]|nr:DUF3617 family protein [Acetobacteraceae bacterium]